VNAESPSSTNLYSELTSTSKYVMTVTVYVYDLVLHRILLLCYQNIGAVGICRYSPMSWLILCLIIFHDIEYCTPRLPRVLGHLQHVPLSLISDVSSTDINSSQFWINEPNLLQIGQGEPLGIATGGFFTGEMSFLSPGQQCQSTDSLVVNANITISCHYQSC